MGPFYSYDDNSEKLKKEQMRNNEDEENWLGISNYFQKNDFFVIFLNFILLFVSYNVIYYLNYWYINILRSNNLNN